jgi:HAD superfamily hydrolase (TIGR01509 family)
MSELRALLWDHDGVLVDTEGLYFQATRELLATVSVTLTEAHYRQLFLIEGRGAWHLARERGVSEREIAALQRARGERYTQLLTAADVLVPGALELLAALAAHYRMAIVTSSHRNHFDAIHRTSGLPAHFEFVLAREDYVHAKPAAEPYERAVARLGLAPNECLVIEDSRRGLLAARAAGLRCWVVPSALTAESSFSEADRRFASLSALGQALLDPAITV